MLLLHTRSTSFLVFKDDTKRRLAVREINKGENLHTPQPLDELISGLCSAMGFLRKNGFETKFFEDEPACLVLGLDF